MRTSLLFSFLFMRMLFAVAVGFVVVNVVMWAFFAGSTSFASFWAVLADRHSGLPLAHGGIALLLGFAIAVSYFPFLYWRFLRGPLKLTDVEVSLFG